MLEANKSRLFERIFAIYNRHLIKRRFHSLEVSGFEFLLDKNFNTPLIIYCNHSSWWDGLIVFQILYEAGLNGFVIMEEKNLRKYPLFRRLGAFSVVRENPREALKSINYAAKLLNEDAKKTLWMFPQGEILPNDLRPIKFYGGLAKIVEKVGKCRLASLSMRYDFCAEFKPQIFVKIEEPEILSVNEDFDNKQLTNKLTERLTFNLDKLRNDVIKGDLENYKSFF